MRNSSNKKESYGTAAQQFLLTKIIVTTCQCKGFLSELSCDTIISLVPVYTLYFLDTYFTHFKCFVILLHISIPGISIAYAHTHAHTQISVCYHTSIGSINPLIQLTNIQNIILLSNCNSNMDFV